MKGTPMANIIGIPILIVTGVLVLVLAAATVNDPACAAVANHIPAIRAVERFLMLCWAV